MLKWVSNLFDAGNKMVKQAEPIVKRVNELAPEFNRLSDEQLRQKSVEFQQRYLEAIQAAEADEKNAFEVRQAGEAVLLEIMPEAFAAVREAAQRTIGMRHYDVQLIGGYVLHRGNIAEMKTGEGKTLVASLPLYLNALTGRGAHLVTVNDYLAKRDARWMAPIYHLLGLTVGVLQHETAYLYDPTYVTGDERTDYLRPVPRREAYLADITYGTNNEFGFDYLRDNMATNLANTVQRELYFAIVDEVDNILIDEARTPLIISGPSRKSTDWYTRFAQIARTFVPADYEVDEKRRAITPNDSAISKVERELGIANLYEEGESGTLLHADKVHHLEQALKAQVLFKRDKEYVVEGGEVVIVDEFTGRKMPGRRYSDGLHEAIEAKEGVRVQKQTVTYATITVQNYFRMYKKLGGMTGTALTEQEEFFKIYQLEVAPIPTHRPVQRRDLADFVYKTEEAKFNAVADEVEELYAAGLPVLVGTISIEKSEELSRLLTRRNIPHSVLNAKLHEQEALIIAQAGRPGAVTIATNMAGRGVDILLGGNPERLAMDMLKQRRAEINATVSEEERRKDARAAQQGEVVEQKLDEVEADIADLQYHGFSKEDWEATLAEAKQICAAAHEEVIRPREEFEGVAGLCVIGTERHEARRIDNQLRGRSGRQGDPGYSRFYISLEDDLMRRFGSDRISGLMTRFGMDDSTPIESGAVSKAIESAQTKVEGYNFDTRKHVLQYDDVMNKQRAVIYEDRRRLLEANGEELRAQMLERIKAELEDIAHSNAFVNEDKTRNLPQMFAMIGQVLPLDTPLINQYRDIWELPPDQLAEALGELAEELYAKKEAAEGEDHMRIIERSIMLQVIDTMWVDYLTEMEALREGIGLRAYGQKDPLVEYKIEAARMFNGLKADIQGVIARNIFGARIVEQKAPSKKAAHREEVRQRQSQPATGPVQTLPQPQQMPQPQRPPKKGKPQPTRQGRAPRSAR